MSDQSDVLTTTLLSQEIQHTEEVSSLASSSPDQIIHEEHPPAGHPQGSPSEASHSDSGFSLSSNSSGDITGTPFDFGSQRYEYPFPPAQGASGEPFLPLSSSITIPSPPNSNSPSWPLQVINSFPLTAPPTGKVRTHPKLRSVTAREPPVPPSLVNKRSFWSLSLQRQASAESQQSDVSDPPPRGRKLCPYSMGYTEQDVQHASDSEMTVRQRPPSARSASASRSRKRTSQRVANQKASITGGDCAPEVLAAGASASSPGPNGAHRQLDVRPHLYKPSGANLLTAYRPVSYGQGVHQIELMYESHPSASSSGWSLVDVGDDYLLTALHDVFSY
ncbi:hypothetical protein K503DRAFT_840493 [Rhizopogon vinicolor AM-OR11-026]|uniref:Uncharacterized protein n=1 Tax=Rhizopogon vinicolor AM-OR11-026 TaxID=1314800 RepID=A0A1B7MKC2_9AGAM|nr:hypothetical protein K503DRAFT_840493 [Rhizopogon vinicolor AM-OR11-026]